MGVPERVENECVDTEDAMCTYTGILFSLRKEAQSAISETTMDPEDMLSAVSQTQNLKTVNSQNQRIGWWFPEAETERRWYQVSVTHGKWVPEIQGRAQCL